MMFAVAILFLACVITTLRLVALPWTLQGWLIWELNAPSEYILVNPRALGNEISQNTSRHHHMRDVANLDHG